MPKKRFLRLTVYLLLIPPIILIFIQLCFTFYFNTKIISYLQEQLNKQTGGEYVLKIQHLSTNIFNQSIFISGFLLNPVKDINPNAQKYYATSGEINFIDVGLISYLFKKELIVNRIELLNPSVTHFKNLEGFKYRTKDSTAHFSPYILISKSINSLTIKKIEITGSNISVYDYMTDTIPSMSSKSNEFSITNLQINKTAEENGRLFIADEFVFTLNKINYTTTNNLYTILINKISSSYSDSTLTLDSLAVIPNFSKHDFARKAGKQIDRINLSVGKATFGKMNIKLLLERNNLIAGSLLIDTVNLAVYRDKNPKSIKVKPKSIQQLVQNIPIYTLIDTIKITNTLIVYEELGIGSIEPGKIIFNHVNAVATGLTNDSTLYTNKPDLEIKAISRFMNKANLSVHYRFPLKTQQMRFSCEGKLKEMPIQAINSMLEHNAGISIKNGIIDSMLFAFHADETSSNGKMELVYHQLKIEFKNKNLEKTNALDDVLSFLAHRLIIKEDNPVKNESIRKAEIYYPRNDYRFIFNYSWKSLLSGIKQTIGIPSPKTKKT